MSTLPFVSRWDFFDRVYIAKSKRYRRRIRNSSYPRQWQLLSIIQTASCLHSIQKPKIPTQQSTRKLHNMATTRTLRFLTASQVQRLHSTAIYWEGRPSQPDLLESAVASPINIRHYTQQENLFQLAACLSEKIMKNHAFPDGNKRTALLAADMFLRLNGYGLHTDPPSPDKNHDAIAHAQVATCTARWTAEQLGGFYETLAFLKRGVVAPTIG